MDATNKLFKFAAECEDMAKAADHNNDKAAWRDLAQRLAMDGDLTEQHSRLAASKVKGRDHDFSSISHGTACRCGG
jgi:hypothetical protein